MFPFSGWSKKRSQQQKPSKRACKLETLEGRSLLTTFAVVNLNDSGEGSLRQAVLDANSTLGADTIEFDVAGTIGLKSALPAITDEVNIDGTTAPGYANAPVVQIDFNNKAGLKFNTGSDGSALRSLSLVDASASGVKLDGAGDILIVGNFIGLGLDGSTVVANRTHGIELVNSNLNTIGGDDATERNVVSGNKNEGIHVSNSASNLINGNYVGTDSTGTLSRGNGRSGIILTDGATANVIGELAGNVVSGNKSNGVYIKNNSTGNKVTGNIIGLNAAGTAALGNGLDGVKIENASNNVVGHIDPITGIDYYGTDDIGADITGWAGIRGGDDDGEYLITGSADVGGVLSGVLYVGNIEGTSGDAYTFLYPGADNTNAYGPNNLGSGNLQIVGTYGVSGSSVVNSFLFEGTTAELESNGGTWTPINYPGAQYTYAHSTAGGLVVGNYDNPDDHGGQLPYGPGHAFIYDIATDTFVDEIHFPGSISNSAYGIWSNGGTKYTIVGGYSTAPVDNFSDQNQPIGKGYIVDYDSSTGEFTHWLSLEYPNGENFLTHIEAISSVEDGVYTLGADSVESGTVHPTVGSWVSVLRNADGSFSVQDWVDLHITTNPNTGDPVEGLANGNSVYGNQIIGLFVGDEVFNYQATINSGFQLSNVISGNKGNGVELYNASNNSVAMNYIGTDITGLVDLGNGSNGILITAGSTANMIGGVATGGNDPTNGVFVQPPQGNVISGNNANGVLINSKSTNNQLSGNFIGTDVTGNTALGNSQDGVLIDKADSNSLLGTTFHQSPFVFYNVLSGNGGNGLRVNNSNNTVIQANFFGLGADNDTPVGNALNGVTVEGNSATTTMGGPIPLGNVTAANGQNGVVVQDKASGFISYNTFAGVSAFGEQTDLGNAQDGMLITTTGKDNLIRTNVVSGNGDDGIEVSGNAKYLQIVDNIIGLNWDGFAALGNDGNGIEVGGNANGIVIGNPLGDLSVIPHNAIGDNAYGIAVVGKAKNTVINHTFVGTDINGETALGNALAGVLLGSGTSGTTIGSTDEVLKTLISGNAGSGIQLENTTGNTIIGTLIGTEVDGEHDLANGWDGIHIINSSRNTIGGTAEGEGNTIAFNPRFGVQVESGTRNGILGNSIYGNGTSGIELGNGANNNQPAPVLTTLAHVTGGLQVSGTLTAKKKTTYTLEFFASHTNDASGRTYLGSLTVTTNSSGVATFSGTVDEPPIGADYITGTATDPDNNTSEFSAAMWLP